MFYITNLLVLIVLSFSCQGQQSIPFNLVKEFKSELYCEFATDMFIYNDTNSSYAIVASHWDKLLMVDLETMMPALVINENEEEIQVNNVFLYKDNLYFTFRTGRMGKIDMKNENLTFKTSHIKEYNLKSYKDQVLGWAGIYKNMICVSIGNLGIACFDQNLDTIIDFFPFQKSEIELTDFIVVNNELFVNHVKLLKWSENDDKFNTANQIIDYIDNIPGYLSKDSFIYLVGVINDNLNNNAIFKTDLFISNIIVSVDITNSQRIVALSKFKGGVISLFEDGAIVIYNWDLAPIKKYYLEGAPFEGSNIIPSAQISNDLIIINSSPGCSFKVFQIPEEYTD